MNETIRILHAHRSYRSYTDETVSDEMLDQIIEAGYRSPTSINGQQVSLIVVRDAERRKRIAEISGGQAWIAKAPVFIALVMDFYKTGLGVKKAGQDQVIHESVEGMMVGSVDSGIALGNMMTAARALGLGIVPIGGIRRDPQAMIDLLELPSQTFPVVGMCIGHVEKEPPQKPRLPLASFRHEEHYRAAALPQMIATYDVQLHEYWLKIGRPEGLKWSDNMGEKYSSVYFPNVKPVAAKQGFLNDK